MILNCPGSSKFKQPYPENIDCQHCGHTVEIWTDERSVLCSNCGYKAGRAREHSCLDWCKYAAICAGYKIIVEKQGRV